MNNIIVREASSEIRGIARDALRERWFQVSLGMLIYYIFISFIPDIFQTFVPFGTTTYYDPTTETTERFSNIAALYYLVFIGPFSFGMCNFILAFFRTRNVEYGRLFFGLEKFAKTLGLMLLEGVFIFLWSFLLIVPGIIAAYRYSMAFYIMVDNPEMGILDCINASKEMMNGNKGKLFCLQLSFIGWYFVAVLPMSFALGFVGFVNVANVEVLTFVISNLLYLPIVFVIGYFQTAEAVFYNLACGKLVAQNSSNNGVSPQQEEKKEEIHFEPKDFD